MGEEPERLRAGQVAIGELEWEAINRRLDALLAEVERLAGRVAALEETLGEATAFRTHVGLAQSKVLLADVGGPE
jgi:hypothetical protein